MLILNNREMDSEAIVIRIKTPLGDMDSPEYYPSLLNFNDLLDAIRDVMPEATVTAFEYEDEVGDRITVRSDDELKAMLSYYCNTMNEQRMNGMLPDPLQIFPRGIPLILYFFTSFSLKKSSAELKRILTNGQINAQDIHYQEQLGHGNGGTVYKAYHVLSKRVLAVKVIPLDITVELQKQIMSELEILYKVGVDFCPLSSILFITFMDRISRCSQGGSLDVYKRIPEHVLGRIAVAVVKGLTYLWSLKILHRDVKPSNMLVNTRGQVKLCDFGVSTQLVNSIAKTYVGTNAYMAPERISGEQYGIHADVWSVGISFMEIQKNQGSLMVSFIDPPVLPVGQFSEKFVHFITQCMRKSPKERPAPNNLLDHSFIVQYNDGNAEVVSMWVCRCLEERRAPQVQ
uniref:mitogen-activated protein kinase kinase n=1 Tax=Nothobranchius furzeri TaxID=105023 RepID=A0A8C6LNQ0_NOTFU